MNIVIQCETDPYLYALVQTKRKSITWCNLIHSRGLVKIINKRTSVFSVHHVIDDLPYSRNTARANGNIVKYNNILFNDDVKDEFIRQIESYNKFYVTKKSKESDPIVMGYHMYAYALSEKNTYTRMVKISHLEGTSTNMAISFYIRKHMKPLETTDVELLSKLHATKRNCALVNLLRKINVLLDKGGMRTESTGYALTNTQTICDMKLIMSMLNTTIYIEDDIDIT